MAAALIAQPEKFGASCDQGGQQHSTFSSNSGSSAGIGRRLPAAPTDASVAAPAGSAPKHDSAAAGISWYSATALRRPIAEVASRTPAESGSSSSSGGIGESSPDIGHASAGLSGVHLAAESPVAGLDSGCLSCDDNGAASVGAQPTTIEDRLLHSYKALNTAVDSKIQAVLNCFSLTPASAVEVGGAPPPGGSVRSAACSDSGAGSGVPASTSGCAALGQRSRRSCASSTDSEAGVGSYSTDHSRGPFPRVIGSPRSRPAISSALVDSAPADVGCPGGSASGKVEPSRLLHHLRLQLPPMLARTSSSSSGGCCDSPRAGSAPTSTASPGRRSASDDCSSSSSSSSSGSVDSAPSSWSFATADVFASDLILPTAPLADPDGSNEDAASVATDVLLQTADDDIAMVEALLSSDSEAAAAGGACSTSHSSSTRSSFDWQRRAATTGSSPCGTPRSCTSSTGTVATAAVVPASGVAISLSSRGSRSSDSSHSCGQASTPVVTGVQPTPSVAVSADHERRTSGIDRGSRSESCSDSGSGESRPGRSVCEVESSSIGRCPDESASVSSQPQLAVHVAAPGSFVAAAASTPLVREPLGSSEVRRVADGRLVAVPAAARCANPELDVRNAFGGTSGLAGPSTGSHRDDLHLLQACGRQRPPDCSSGASGLLVQGTESSRSAGSSAAIASSGVSSSNSPACGPRLSLLRTEQRSTSRGRESTGRSPGRQTSADAASPSFGRALLRNLSTRSRRDGITAGSAAAGKSGSCGDDLAAGRPPQSAPVASRQHVVHDPPDPVNGFHRADGGRFSLRSRTLADGAQALVPATSSQRLPAAAGYQSAAEARAREPSCTVAATSRGGGGGTSAATGSVTRAPMLLGGALRTSASMERLEQEKAVWRRRKSYDPRRAVAAAAAVSAAATSATAPVVPVGIRLTALPTCASLDTPPAAEHVTPILMPGQRHTVSLSSLPASASLPQQQQSQAPAPLCLSTRSNAPAVATAPEANCNRGIAAALQSQQQPTTHSRRHLPIAADSTLIVDGNDDEEVFGTSHELEQANFRMSREQEIALASSALAANLGLLSSLGPGSSCSGSSGPTVTATSAIAVPSVAAAATVAGKEHRSTRSPPQSVASVEQRPSKREFCTGTAAVSVIPCSASTHGAIRPAAAEQQQQQPDRAHLVARQHQLPLSPLPVPAVAEASVTTVVTAAAGTTASGHELKQQQHAAAPDRSHRSRAADDLIASTPTTEARPSAFRRCGSFRTTDGDPSPSGLSVAASGLLPTANDVPGRTSPSTLSGSQILQPSRAKTYGAAEEEPYNAVVMASIQRLSARLSATSQRLVGMLRERLPPSAAAGLPVSGTTGTAAPGALGGLDAADSAIGGSTSGLCSGGTSALCCEELGSALSSLRQVEQNIGALERSLLLHHGPLSLVMSTSASQDQSRYLAELRQLRSDITGFKSVEDDVPTKTSAPAAAAAGPGQAAHLPVGAVGVAASSGAAFFYAGPSSSAPTAHVRQQVPPAVGTTTGASATRSTAVKASAFPPAQTNGVVPRLGSGVSALAGSTSGHSAGRAAAASGASVRRSFY